MDNYKIEKEQDRNGAAVITWIFIAFIMGGVGLIGYTFI